MARPGPGLSGAAEAALLRRHGHPVLSIAAALAAGAALVVVAAGWRRVLVCWAALELLFYLYQRRRCAQACAAAGGGERGACARARVCHMRRLTRAGLPAQVRRAQCRAGGGRRRGRRAGRPPDAAPAGAEGRHVRAGLFQRVRPRSGPVSELWEAGNAALLAHQFVTGSAPAPTARM